MKHSQNALQLISNDSLNSPSTRSTSPLAAEQPEPLETPSQLKERHPLSASAKAVILQTRESIARRLESGAGMPLAIVGPCSIHCETAALEYAERLQELRARLGDRVEIVMRVYFEKPRTTVGWKGFLYDPDLDGSDDLARGLARARALMVQIAEMGVPIATEILDPMVAEYLGDCITWVAIGARTSESQIHRQLASGLACPVGFKNGTDGSVEIAIQASESAAHPHSHLGIDQHGRAAVLRSRGNPSTHVVLRGGKDGPNHDRESVAKVGETLRKQGKRTSVLIDCSHQNSRKTYSLQPEVARMVMAQMNQEHADVVGLMIESHLRAGFQSLKVNGAPPRLEYGVSVTDGCIDFATTAGLLEELARGHASDTGG